MEPQDYIPIEKQHTF